jgi:GTP pyrophosphokinase
VLTDRFAEALRYAEGLHRNQVRKGNPIPYIAHLLSVTALVLEYGGNEDQAIAALLHDAVEDQGGLDTLEEIRSRFGERVAFLVEGCTDAFTTPKPPWRQRKEDYLAHLHTAPAEVRLVSLADKVHNARSLLRSLRNEGQDTWKHFKGGEKGTLWYYQALLEAFKNPLDPATTELVKELEDTIQAIYQILDHNKACKTTEP